MGYIKLFLPNNEWSLFAFISQMDFIRRPVTDAFNGFNKNHKICLEVGDKILPKINHAPGIVTFKEHFNNKDYKSDRVLDRMHQDIFRNLLQFFSNEYIFDLMKNGAVCSHQEDDVVRTVTTNNYGVVVEKILYIINKKCIFDKNMFIRRYFLNATYVNNNFSLPVLYTLTRFSLFYQSLIFTLILRRFQSGCVLENP